MCFNYGIFIAKMNDFPVMNMFLINSILQRMISKEEKNEWMPAYYFLKVS